MDTAAAPDLPKLRILKYGVSPYREIWKVQKELQRALIEGHGTETLIICQHEPVITIGKSGSYESVLADEAQLRSLGIDVLEVERGGDATYHAPGQIVMYPIVDLRNKKKDVGWYMRSLEEVIIRTLQEFEIKGFRIDGRTGVWTQVSENDMKTGPRKIASIGVRLSRWCSMHGLALNVRNLRDGFSLIYPCGFHDVEMTSIEELTGRTVSISAVQNLLIESFFNIFGYSYGR